MDVVDIALYTRHCVRYSLFSGQSGFDLQLRLPLLLLISLSVLFNYVVWQCFWRCWYCNNSGSKCFSCKSYDFYCSWGSTSSHVSWTISTSICFRILSKHWVELYSGISIKQTLYKADISLRRTFYLGTDGFTVKLLWKNLYKANNYKVDSRKTDTFFVPQMNFLPKNNLSKVDTGTKTIFT